MSYQSIFITISRRGFVEDKAKGWKNLGAKQQAKTAPKLAPSFSSPYS
jgi:hypothetical protein